MDSTDEAIMDVQKQVRIPTPLEQAMTYALTVLDVEEEK